MSKQILLVALVALTTIFTSGSNAADLLASWRAARAYDANFSAAGNALSAGLEKSKQGDSMILPQVALTGPPVASLCNRLQPRCYTVAGAGVSTMTVPPSRTAR